MKPKNQRLILVAVAVVALLGAVLLAMWGLRSQAAYFYTPSDIAAGKAEAGRAMRIGGMVGRGSIKKAPDGVTTTFVVEDEGGSISVIYRGILPDLFKEGSGVVAEGRLMAGAIAQPGSRPPVTYMFLAETILAKHDERYMPPQMGNQAAEHKAAETLDR